MSVRVAEVLDRVRSIDPEATVIGLPGPHDEIVDLTNDSREIRPHWAFAAVPGAAHDGHDHVAAAVSAGAIAVLVERPMPVDVPQIVTGSVRRAMGPAAAAVHGDPSRRLSVVGVTGTNGKTTTTWLLHAVLGAAGRRCELVGTLTGVRTTPEAPELQRRLGRWAVGGTEVVAMEVSSHALALGRVDGCHFAVGVFTNLTPEHLDFHGTMDAYGAAKASLFEAGRTDIAVIDVDDDFGRVLAERVGIDVVPFSIADAVDVAADAEGTSFTWSGRPMRVHLPGRFNLSNALAAATAARTLGVAVDAIGAGLDGARSVPGRMEAIDGGQDFGVVVDYAHTPDAVSRSLAALREVADDGARLLAVLGCGGERDEQKRPLMGAAITAGADVSVITSDNPRRENPGAIIDDILSGVPGWQDRDDLIVEPDRRAAIARALDLARPGDVVLIAGKGHETYQDIGGELHDFDDRDVARSLLHELAGRPDP